MQDKKTFPLFRIIVVSLLLLSLLALIGLLLRPNITISPPYQPTPTAKDEFIPYTPLFAPIEIKEQKQFGELSVEKEYLGWWTVSLATQPQTNTINTLNSIEEPPVCKGPNPPQWCSNPKPTPPQICDGPNPPQPCQGHSPVPIPNPGCPPLCIPTINIPFPDIAKPELLQVVKLWGNLEPLGFKVEVDNLQKKQLRIAVRFKVLASTSNSLNAGFGLSYRDNPGTFFLNPLLLEAQIGQDGASEEDKSTNWTKWSPPVSLVKQTGEVTNQGDSFIWPIQINGDTISLEVHALTTKQLSQPSKTSVYKDTGGGAAGIVMQVRPQKGDQFAICHRLFSICFTDTLVV